MAFVGKLGFVFAALGLSACAVVDTPTRNAPFEGIAPAPLTAMVQGDAPHTIAPGFASFAPQEFRVTVPRDLVVSEENKYFPGGDIVWRGDAPGNRHEQIEAMFKTGADMVTAKVDGTRPVLVDIRVQRFHALTEKTRYTVGGIHSIKFVMTLLDPETGAVLRAPKLINADLVGYGGDQALEAEAKGMTQKVRITHHLARVIHDELTEPGGFALPRAGVTRRVTPI